MSSLASKSRNDKLFNPQSLGPGCGRSRRTITRAPSGQPEPDRSRSRVRSVTWPFSRGWPSWSSAGVQACSSTARIARRTGSVRSKPTENWMRASRQAAAARGWHPPRRRGSRSRRARRRRATSGPARRRAPARGRGVVGAGVAGPQHAGQRLPAGGQVRTVQVGQRDETRTRPLNVPAAPSLSECAVISVASMSMISGLADWAPSPNTGPRAARPGRPGFVE